jgi:SulP family sulfate permease
VLYIYASSKATRVRQIVRNEDGRYEERDLPDTFSSNEATVIWVSGPEFYGDVPTMDEALPDKVGVTNAVVILRLRGRESAGSTGIKWLEKYAEELRDGGNLLLLAGIEQGFLEVLEHSGAIDVVGRENVFLVQPGIGASLDAAQEAAQKWLAAQATESA